MVKIIDNPMNKWMIWEFSHTPPETNISPENKPLGSLEIPIGKHPFLGAKMLVSGSVFLDLHPYVDDPP